MADGMFHKKGTIHAQERAAKFRDGRLQRERKEQQQQELQRRFEQLPEEVSFERILSP